jgi:hypothetical protein
MPGNGQHHIAIAEAGDLLDLNAEHLA